MAFMLDYDTVLGVLAIMERTMNDMDTALEEFAVYTARFNSTIQDNTAREATILVNEMRNTILQTKECIEKSSKKVQQAATGLKGLEERIKDGGLRS